MPVVAGLLSLLPGAPEADGSGAEPTLTSFLPGGTPHCALTSWWTDVRPSVGQPLGRCLRNAVLDRPANGAQVAQVAQRVLPQDDEISALAHLHGADLVLQREHSGRDTGRGGEGVPRRQAGVAE